MAPRRPRAHARAHARRSFREYGDSTVSALRGCLSLFRKYSCPVFARRNIWQVQDRDHEGLAELLGLGEHGAAAGRALPGASQRRKRAALRAVAPALERLLGPDEHVLHVAPAMERVSLLHQLGLGWWLASRYHQVALVFTDRRLIEILLDFRGQKPATRTRSWPWRELAASKISWQGLVLKPSSAKGAWTISVRGDGSSSSASSAHPGGRAPMPQARRGRSRSGTVRSVAAS